MRRREGCRGGGGSARVFGGKDVRVGHGMSTSGDDGDILKLNARDGGVRLAPYDTGHLAALEVGVAVSRADVLEGDIPYRAPLVSALRHPRGSLRIHAVTDRARVKKRVRLSELRFTE